MIAIEGFIIWVSLGSSLSPLEVPVIPFIKVSQAKCLYMLLPLDLLQNKLAAIAAVLYADHVSSEATTLKLL